MTTSSLKQLPAYASSAVGAGGAGRFLRTGPPSLVAAANAAGRAGEARERRWLGPFPSFSAVFAADGGAAPRGLQSTDLVPK